MSDPINQKKLPESYDRDTLKLNLTAGAKKLVIYHFKM